MHQYFEYPIQSIMLRLMFWSEFGRLIDLRSHENILRNAYLGGVLKSLWTDDIWHMRELVASWLD